MLHVAQISFFNDPRRRTPAQMLRDWPTLVAVAEAASRAGVRISVLQASVHASHEVSNGVGFHFLPFGRGLSPRDPAGGIRALLRALVPDVLHVQGLDFGDDVAALAAIVPGVPLLLQDHASGVPRRWRRAAWRRGFAAASALAFCSLEQAKPFAAAGLLPPRTRVYEIPESTSRFAAGDRAHARLLTGLSGDPAVLWVGHLDANKDPLTVLEGISRAARTLPDLRLYCCYAAAPLARAVRRRIAGDRLLATRVHLLGRVAHAQVEHWMRAADVFVSGSHREGSGYALIEALACGLPPIVTDIPSFRALTGAGRVGALWDRGEAGQLCERLCAMAERPRAPIRAAARAHFEQEISFDAVGRKLAAAYHELADRRVQRRGHPNAPTVSIIMPVFNRLRFMRAAVESVLAQTCDDWELIIADDGSGMETRSYLSTLEAEARLKVIWLSHSANPAAVRNAGLRAARGRYIAFLDSDDVWAPSKLARQLTSLRSKPECAWSYTGFVAVDAALEPLLGSRALRTPVVGGWILPRLLTMESTIALPSVLATRDLIERVGGFDEGLRMCEDYDLWLRLASISKVDAVAETLVFVRRHGEHSGDDVTAFRDMARVLEKLRRSGTAAHLKSAVRRRRAMVCAGLAKSHAVSGHRTAVLSTVVSGVRYAWNYRDWWRLALTALARAFVPAPWRNALRRRPRGDHRSVRPA